MSDEFSIVIEDIATRDAQIALLKAEVKILLRERTDLCAELARLKDRVEIRRDTISDLQKNLADTRLQRDRFAIAMKQALDELGGCTYVYPTPIANAVELLTASLKGVVSNG